MLSISDPNLGSFRKRQATAKAQDGQPKAHGTDSRDKDVADAWTELTFHWIHMDHTSNFKL